MNKSEPKRNGRISKDNISEYLRAASEGNARRVRAFLKVGIDVNATYKGGTKALINAAENGHTEIVRLLLEHGANPSARAATVKRWGTKFEKDALGLAAEKGHLKIVRLLVRAGANVNESINYNLDALNAAVVEGHVEIVRELLNAGYLVNGQGVWLASS